jgi:uncharacterized protein
MQLNLLTSQGYFFSNYDSNSVTVTKKNQDGEKIFNQEYSSNIIITQDDVKIYNEQSLDDFSLYDQIIDSDIDLVIFGINDYNKLYHHPTMLKLNQLKIGYELMSITATCKSFNYLSAENRKPLAIIYFQYLLK